MTILDHQGIFSLAQAITATAVSTNVIDFGAPETPYGSGQAVEQDQGKGHQIPLLVQVVTDFASAEADNTLTINLQTSPVEGFGSGVKTIALATAVPKADLEAGYVIPWDVFPKGTDQRFARLQYVVGGTGNFSAGAITAGTAAAVQSN